MIRRIILGSAFILSVQMVQGQIGIGTTTPDESSVLEVSGTDKGLLIPRITSVQRENIVNPAKGLMIYNLTESCLQVNSGTLVSPSWSCVGAVESNTSLAAVISTCDVNGFEGAYTNGAALDATNKFTVTLTNNSFTDENISFSVGDLNLSGVSGITVSGVNPSNVLLNSGSSQLVEYTLTGTPESTGTLVGFWKKLALTCTKIEVVTTN